MAFAHDGLLKIKCEERVRAARSCESCSLLNGIAGGSSPTVTTDERTGPAVKL
jgi:hypothetical protein